MSINLEALAGGFVENTGEILLGFGVGTALAEALHPEAVELGQASWRLNRIKALDPAEAARAEAQGYTGTLDGDGEAAAAGISPDRYQALRFLAQTAPGAPELIELWRRGEIDREQATAGLRKAGLQDEYVAPVLALFTDRLDPAVVALAIVRGLIADPGILPVSPPTGEGRVPAFPRFSIDAAKEAEAHGIDLERLSVMVGNMGRPASPDQAARAMWRGELDKIDYQRAISEGDVRNEWADAILASLVEIPTATDYVQARLRAWIDTEQMHAGAAKHGMAATDADLLLKIHGRPLSWHQVFIGLRRGGVYDGPTTDIDPAFLKALEESDIRPEWYNLAWAQRYSYPSAFVLRTLTQSGDITGDEVHAILLDEGWEPTLAAKVAARWAGGTAAKADAHITKAETQLWAALHKSYVNGETTDQAAQTDLAALGVAPDATPAVLHLWQLERNVVRRSLTPAQIRKAIGQPGLDQAWALARLGELGYTRQDAETFLAE